MKHEIKVGQIYLAADGSKGGHLVTNVEKFSHCDDIVTNPFTADGFKGDGNRIDAFKLSKVRYYLAKTLPAWMPKMPSKT